jgi:chromosome partitioning protein
MSVVAIYNMKGGVGKTTTAVTLSYFAAADGHRTLLWDLDAQGASSFAFRIRPRVPGFGKRALKTGELLEAAIKETDYHNLDLLPADFTYRKLDRLLGHFGRPKDAVAALLDTIARDYDTVLLDCPPGFSLLTEGLFAAVDAVLVPTIPTTLSLRTLGRMIKWAERSDSASDVAAFFNMVDRRKTLHRRACEWSARQSEIFLAGQIPYASAVEQVGILRMPLPVFAPREPASHAFAAVWAELQTRVQQRRIAGRPPLKDRWIIQLRSIESLIVQLESLHSQEGAVSDVAAADDRIDSRSARRDPAADGRGDTLFVHRFDTDERHLQHCGCVLELHERGGTFLVVAARSDVNENVADTAGRALAQIDAGWASGILSGRMSPLDALQHRLGPTAMVDHVRAVVAARRLVRIDSVINQGENLALQWSRR